MNQKSRQKAISSAERDFYKLLNNANFGIDCRNNIGNCTLKPIYDEISETAYIKRFDSIFDNENYRNFYDVEIMREDVNQKFDQLILNLDKNGPTYEARKYWYQNKKEEDLDSIHSLEAKRKKSGKKRKFHDTEKKIEETTKSKKTKMIPKFNCRESASIKSFAVKKNDQVKLTTRFLSGKMLMFTKLSLMSFIFNMLETFCFPDEKVQKILQKYMIEKVHIYHILTNTDSTCLKFLFVSKPDNAICENKHRDVIFEIIIASKVYNRFDNFRDNNSI